MPIVQTRFFDYDETFFRIGNKSINIKMKKGWRGIKLKAAKPTQAGFEIIQLISQAENNDSFIKYYTNLYNSHFTEILISDITKINKDWTWETN